MYRRRRRRARAPPSLKHADGRVAAAIDGAAWRAIAAAAAECPIFLYPVPRVGEWVLFVGQWRGDTLQVRVAVHESMAVVVVNCAFPSSRRRIAETTYSVFMSSFHVSSGETGMR